MNTALLVNKAQLSQTELRDLPEEALADGQARVRIDHFALTSNNITYAAFGDAMNYWGFYPMTAPGDEAWGRIPVWGFGSVVQSLHPGVAVGERLYGYFPMAQTVVLSPGKLSVTGFSDCAPHRAQLHAVYNQYTRSGSDPYYTADTEPLQALLRPLFITSWLIDDFFADNGFFGANTLILSSASSKTAYGTAFVLAQRNAANPAGERVDVIGLTSASNAAFCESLGVYDRVLAYDQLNQIDANVACAYVDFAGNAKLRRSIHTDFAHLNYSCSIGGTHVTELGGAKDLPGPKATLFFAPAQIKKRSIEWGGAVLGQRLVHSWQLFAQAVAKPEAPWMTVQRHAGGAAVQSGYAQVLEGATDARVGHVMSMHGA